jgi:hypothetical protein
MAGLLNAAGINNGFTTWWDANRRALTGFGVGLANGPTLSQGIGLGTQGLAQGAEADDAYATQQKAEAERQAQINQTAALKDKYAKWFLDQGKPDIARGIADGIIDPGEAYMDALTPKGPDLPYEGTGMDAQNWNIVLTGDPNSPEYAAAYSQISQPKMQMQMTEQGLVPVWSTPQLPANIRPPTSMAGAAPMGGAGPAGSGISTGSVIPGTQKAPTEQRARAQMMDSVISPEIETLLGDGTAQNPGTMDALNNGWDVAKDATGTAGRFAPFGVGTPSENFLKAKNAVRTLIASYLYVASGATANPGEVENQAAILTPQVGDPPNVVAGKKARIKVMADAVKALARGEAVDLNAVMAGGSQAGGMESTGDPELDAALQQYGG